MQKLMNKSHKEKLPIIHCDYGKLSFLAINASGGSDWQSTQMLAALFESKD